MSEQDEVERAHPWDNDYPMGCPGCHARSSVATKDEPCQGFCHVNAAFDAEYKRGQREERERAAKTKWKGWRARLDKIRGRLAGPATTVSFLAAEEDGDGDAVRWEDVERIFDDEIAAAIRRGEDGE
jgi:hypothetical protein